MAADTPNVWFQQLITSAIDSASWTQVTLADAVGVTQQTVSNWRKGTMPSSPDVAVQIALALGEDPVEVVHRLWPSVAAHDPVPPELREALRHLSRREINAVTGFARSSVKVKPEQFATAANTGAGGRIVREGRRPRPRAEDDA